MTVSTALEAHQKIEQFSETESVSTLRIAPKMKIGQVARQGDVYIAAISKKSIKDYKQTSEYNGKPLQLVPGNTQGSRHVLEMVDGNTMKIYMPENKSELFGPIIESTAAFTITHPEHAHIQFQPGLYQVTFQKDWAEAERRIRD